MHPYLPAPLPRPTDVMLALLDEHRLREVVSGELAAQLGALEARLVERLSPTPRTDEPSDRDALLTERDVAALLKCHARTVRRLEQRGELPRAIRIGGSKRYRASDVRDWLGKETDRMRRSA